MFLGVLHKNSGSFFKRLLCKQRKKERKLLRNANILRKKERKKENKERTNERKLQRYVNKLKKKERKKKLT